MLQLADVLLDEVERLPLSPEAGVVRCINGLTSWYQGNDVGGGAHYERKLAIINRERDRDHAICFRQD